MEIVLTLNSAVYDFEYMCSLAKYACVQNMRCPFIHNVTKQRFNGTPMVPLTQNVVIRSGQAYVLVIFKSMMQDNTYYLL